jgi:hypothetical protein
VLSEYSDLPLKPMLIKDIYANKKKKGWQSGSSIKSTCNCEVLSSYPVLQKKKKKKKINENVQHTSELCTWKWLKWAKELPAWLKW